MEVLQTSALPLGDGAPTETRAGWKRKKETVPRSSADEAATTALRRMRMFLLTIRFKAVDRTVADSPPSRLRRYGGQPSRGLPTEARASERRLERETGFEPATSTLARSHSTTELFPLDRLKYHTAGFAFKATRPTAAGRGAIATRSRP